MAGMVVKELFAKLGLDIDAQSFAKGQLAVEAIKFGLGKVVEVAKETFDAFKENIKSTIEYGDKTAKAAQAVGVTTDELQKLQYAASLSNVSADELNGSLAILTRMMRAAASGTKAQSEAFAKIGVKVKDANGHLRDAGDVMGDIADHFAEMPDGADKTALAMQLFGRAGARMIPVLNEGGDGLEELGREAEQLGVVMGENAVKASEELNDNLDRLGSVSKGLWRSAIAPLMPAINDLVKGFLEWRKANAAILRQSLQGVIKGLIAVVHGLGVGLKVVIGLIKFFKDNWKALAVVAIGVTAAWTLANSALVASFIATQAAAVGAAIAAAAAWVVAAAPFLLIAGLIAGMLLVFDDFRVYEKGGKSLYGRFKKEIDTWLEDKADDVWFVRALKFLMRDIKNLLDGTAWKDFMEELHWLAGAGIFGAVPQLMEKQRYARGEIGELGRGDYERLGLSEKAKEALAKQGGIEGARANIRAKQAEAITGYYGRYETPTSNTFSVGKIEVNAPNVKDAENLGPVLKDAMEDWYNGKMEETNAALGGNQ